MYVLYVCFHLGRFRCEHWACLTCSLSTLSIKSGIDRLLINTGQKRVKIHKPFPLETISLQSPYSPPYSLVRIKNREKLNMLEILPFLQFPPLLRL